MRCFVFLSALTGLILIAGCDGGAPREAGPSSSAAGQTGASQAFPTSSSKAPAGPKELTRAPVPTPAATPSPSSISRAPVVEVIGPDRPAEPLQIGRHIMPLTRILQIARRAVPGEVIEVDLDEDDDDGSAEYDLEILTPEGRSIEVKIDARRGTILQIEED